MSFLALTKNANSVVGATSAAGTGAITLLLLVCIYDLDVSGHTFDFFKRHRSQALHTRLRTLLSEWAECSDDGVDCLAAIAIYDPNGEIKATASWNRITGRTKSLFIFFCWVSCLSSLDIQAGNDGIRIRDWIADRLSFAVSNGLAVFRVAMTGWSNVVEVSDFGVLYWSDVSYINPSLI